MSVNDPRLHFGLGSALQADFDIFWPSGQTEHLKAVAADQLITVQEGKGIIAKAQFHAS